MWGCGETVWWLDAEIWSEDYDRTEEDQMIEHKDALIKRGKMKIYF